MKWRIWPFPCCEEAAPCQVHTALIGRTVYLADPMRADLEAIAERKGSTLREVAAEALAAYLAAPRS